MKAIASALVKAQKEFGPALKTSNNPHFRSRYADLSACVEAVIDALNNNGIYLMQLNEERENGICVQTIFIHESGEQMSSGSLYVPADKHNAQGFGSALTYARRYSLMAACGIAPEDDDGTEAANTTPTTPPQAAPKAAPKPPLAVPKQVSGKDNEWQLKVSAKPDTNFEDWLAVVVAASVTALDTAESRQQVMDIWRTNNNIYELIKQQDIAAYNELLQTFGAYKEAFPDGK
jgi:hypothetical protein